MNGIRLKEPRLRLDPESYEQLRRELLRRDGWRCQSCGSAENLQIHHKEFRSRCGNDSEENLITLCADCHNSIHQGRRE
jgi:5-methylcytosine-specific restriction endonuclease McrA